MDPKEEYQVRLDRWREKEHYYDQRHRRLGGLRILFALVLLALVWFCGRTFLAVEVVFTGIIAALFFSGMIHDRVLKLRDNAGRARRFYQSGVDRLDDKWAGKGPAGTEFLDPQHPYAID